jgi:hypothetical protein
MLTTQFVDAYKGLSVKFNAVNNAKANFNIDTTDAKISLGEDKRTVLYDADGTGSGDAIVVGTIFKESIPVVPDFSDLS